VVQAVRLALGVVLFCFLGVAHAQQVPTCTLTAEPATVLGQGQVTLTWSSTGATTCVASGGWAGVKECSGSQTLTVSQSRTFILTAKSAQGKVTARWTKPTQNEDGTPMTVLGYKLFVGDAPSELPGATAINLPPTPLEYVFWRAPGDVSAGIKAVRSDGVDSNLSNVSSKNVVAASGKCEDSVTVNPRPKAPTLTLSWLKEILGIDGKPEDRT
jgi:hypothetical protein